MARGLLSAWLELGPGVVMRRVCGHMHEGLRVLAWFTIASAGCDGGGGGGAHDAAVPEYDADLPHASACTPLASAPRARGLRINELVAANDGAAVDELGETDDYVELINVTAGTLALGGVRVRDGNGNVTSLPDEELAAGARVVLWADGEPEQGAHHLPFKLSRDGEEVALWDVDCTELDRVQSPALDANDAYARFPDGAGAFARCRYASVGRDNGAQCEPPTPAGLPDSVTFAAYTWPDPFPASRDGIVITEFAWSPDAFVELANTSSRPLTLGDVRLLVAPHVAGTALPDVSSGAEVALPSVTLDPGARLSVSVDDALLAPIRATAAREGVVTLLDASGAEEERLEFAALPDGTSLAREVAGPRTFVLCSNPTPDTDAPCEALLERALPEHIRALHTPGDFAALAAGGTEVGMSAVKFVIDMQAGDAVYLLSSEAYALHYTFVREVIEGLPALDRCDADDARAFNQGWYEFSVREYFRAEGRRYLLGTLVEHASGLHTVEFAVGDEITAAQMEHAFFTVVARTPNASAWALRPADAEQLQRMQSIEGRLPIVGLNAPYRDLKYQPLTRAVGYGTLRFVPAAELLDTPLGPQQIVVTDDVPNDIPLVGGLVTEAFQTPLAHVNVLSEARGTPNMALRAARMDPRLLALRDKLVRLEVGASDFDVREASVEEASAFYASRTPSGPRIVPLHDDSLRGVIPLAGRGFLDARYVGSKAAQLAELAKVKTAHADCPVDGVPLNLPPDALAVPFAHYLDHFAASGAQAVLETALTDAAFIADGSVRSAKLAQVRNLMLDQPVDAALLAELEDAVRARFGTTDLRLRSSSNVEDLDTFNGAGLHTSSGASLAAKPETSLEDALRIVWSSLWNERAFDEREVGFLSQVDARMGVLVHGRFAGEAAQGVAISRNLFDVTRSDIYYVNAQVGEATVTNPAPSVVTEQLLYQWPPRTPPITYQSRSSLNYGAPVLSSAEVRTLACALGAIHDHFRPLLDPSGEDRTFAMQIEWKLERGTRALAIKQARPQPFGHASFPNDCREL